MNPKDLTNAGINRINRMLMRFRLGVQYNCGLVKDYQPNPFSKKSKRSTGGRLCEDRYNVIANCLPDQPLSFIDLGCNCGYFTFRMAEKGGFGIGIEAGRNEIMICQTLAALHRIRSVAFSRTLLTPDNIDTLPKVDMIICLSLFHHFVRYYGQKSAHFMLDVIANKAEQYLVFETGQPDEDADWATELQFMKPDPKIWIETRLMELGFDSVQYMGLFSTTVSKVQRHLFVAERLIDKTKK